MANVYIGKFKITKTTHCFRLCTFIRQFTILKKFFFFWSNNVHKACLFKYNLVR